MGQILKLKFVFQNWPTISSFLQSYKNIMFFFTTSRNAMHTFQKVPLSISPRFFNHCTAKIKISLRNLACLLGWLYDSYIVYTCHVLLGTITILHSVGIHWKKTKFEFIGRKNGISEVWDSHFIKLLILQSCSVLFVFVLISYTF